MSQTTHAARTFIFLLIAMSGATFAADPTLLQSTFPSLGLEPGESPYRASADLPGHGLPLIHVTNPSNDHPATVRIVAWSAETGQSRWFLVHLEPRGSSTLSLEGTDRFSHLSLVGKETFSVELSSTVDDPSRAVPVFQDRGPVARSVACDKDWKLTCESGGCSGLGPFTAPGRVENGDQVYWNLNTPTGPWTTVGTQGITATWTAGLGPCPFRVTNSLGHTYRVRPLVTP